MTEKNTEWVETEGCTIKRQPDENGKYTAFTPQGMRKLKWDELSPEAKRALQTDPEAGDDGSNVQD